MMRVHSAEIAVKTKGKQTVEITERVAAEVKASAISEGTVTVMVRHTSASLIIFENADPTARVDLETFFERLVPEGYEGFTHTLEGADDMPSHVRMVLTRTSEVIPLHRGKMMLGTWQGIFLFEHRRSPHLRRIFITVMGA